jgi:hypothetical protein
LGRRFGLLSDRYTAILRAEERHIPEETRGQIRTACGMSQLLVSEKLGQFDKLLQQHQTPNSDAPPVHLDDLRAFFDLVALQINDLDARFSRLRALKKQKWKVSVRIIFKYHFFRLVFFFYISNTQSTFYF